MSLHLAPEGVASATPQPAPTGRCATPIHFDLREGLEVGMVHHYLAEGLRCADGGQRVLAFYLVEMTERRLHNATGHSSTAFYAEARLGLDRRRTAELVSIGRLLLSLQKIDMAFRAGRITWTQVLLLTQVATPPHEEAWLERALRSSCRELAQEVRLSKPGAAPRKPGEAKGLPEIRFKVAASVGVLVHTTWELAKQKLSAERGRALTDAEALAVAAELLLQSEEDGTVPGRVKVNSSLYRIVVRPADTEAGDDEDGGGALAVEDEVGPLPVDEPSSADPVARVASDTIRCDGEHVHDDGELMDVDAKTSPALRARVIARDNGRCRCCGSGRSLTVHHMQFRSEGGPTRGWNLIAICVLCHSLVHAGLLVIRGKKARKAQFFDRDGKALAARGEWIGSAALLALTFSAPLGSGSAAATPEGAQPRAPHLLDEVPAVVDGAWWRRHAEGLRWGKGGTIEFVGCEAADSGEADDAPPAPAPVPFALAFASVVGQDALLERFEAALDGARARDHAFPHVLLAGPPGTGKTTLAQRLGAALGARMTTASGPLMCDPCALVRLLADVRAGDVIFLDEVHAMPRPVLETLYEAMANRRVSLVLSAGGRTKSVRMDLPSFTLVAATTEEGDLPPAFHSRFGLVESLGRYAREDLAALAGAEAAAEGFDMETAAREALADAARGTPREAVHILRHVLDETAVRGPGDGRHVGTAEVERTLRRLGFDENGLKEAERRYLSVLRRHREPVSLDRLAHWLGVGAQTLLRLVEPWLFERGLVRMTPHGRLAVPEARPMHA